jgi:hypothetical protein
MLELLTDLFERVPLSNIVTEDRFARHRKHTQAANGHAAEPSSIAASHVLSELRCLYINAARNWEGEEAPLHPTVELQAHQPARLTSYQHFIRSRTLNIKNVSVRELAREWRAMSEAQQNEFVPHAHEDAPAQRFVISLPSVPVERTPLLLGDSKWPVSAEHIEEIRTGPSSNIAHTTQVAWDIQRCAVVVFNVVCRHWFCAFLRLRVRSRVRHVVFIAEHSHACYDAMCVSAAST